MTGLGSTSGCRAGALGAAGLRAALLGAALGAGVALPCGAPARALDRSPRPLASRADVRAACGDAEREAPRALYTVDLAPGTWSFGALSPEGFLPVDTSRNLPALGGAVQLLPAGLEPVGLWTTEDRADELVATARRGGVLRLGFFLGFDNHHGTVCLVRSPHAPITVRMDVAFVELSAADGRLVARDDTERLRAWLDDRERDGVPGEGPRGAVGPATLAQGPGGLPDGWAAVLDRFNASGDAARVLGRCHRDGLARGAAPEGRVVVRAEVDGGSGRIVAADVELSSIGDRAEAACVGDALRANLRFPGGRTGRVRLSVPVRLAD